MRSPTIADPLRWSICYEFAGEVRWRIVSLDGSSAQIAQRAEVEIPTHLSDPGSSAPWRSRPPPRGAPRARADGVGRDGRRRSDHVFLSDARFQWGRGLDWCVVEIDLSKEGGAADGTGGDKAR
jgi:hypothetical protein